MTTPQASNLGVSAAFHILTTAFTSFRLHQRYHHREMWWDDFWAAVALLCGLVHMTEPMWCWPPPPGDPHARPRPRPPRPPPGRREIQSILAFWVTSVSFALGIWAARISIGISIARFTPELRLRRILFLSVNIGFALMCFGTLLPEVIICAKDSAWHDDDMTSPYPQCHPYLLSIMKVTLNLAGDVCLGLVPWCMLFYANCKEAYRESLVHVFLPGTLSLLSGVVYTTFVVQSWNGRGAWTEFMELVGHLKLALTLMVSNLPIMIEFTKSAFKRRNDRETSAKSWSGRCSESLVLTEISESVRAADSFTSLQIRNMPPDSSVDHDGRALVSQSGNGGIV